MDNSTIVKLIALDRDRVVLEEAFTLKSLKNKYPKLWLQSQGDRPVFINMCMDKWIGEQDDLKWKVVTFEVG